MPKRQQPPRCSFGDVDVRERTEEISLPVGLALERDRVTLASAGYGPKDRVNATLDSRHKSLIKVHQRSVVPNPSSAEIGLLRVERLTLCPREQREFAPFPMTIDVDKADLAQPAQLRLDIQQLVRGILFFGGYSKRCEELVV
jgi:hypothetical protein